MTAWVDDRASGPMKQIGGEARRMGEGFSKSASALRLFEGAAGQMGGGVADAASKVSGLASVIGSGGPFGLAIAGVTVAVGAANLAYRIFSEESRQAEESARAFAEGMTKMNNVLLRGEDRLLTLSK